MTPEQYTALTDPLRATISARLGVRGRSFRTTVLRAGRLLPAPARDAAASLLALEQRLDNPKLAHRTDPAIARSAAQTVQAYLSHRPEGLRTARRRALLAAELGFRGMVLLVAILTVLRWRGYL